MARWVRVLAPVLVLAVLIVWRIDQKRTEDKAQADQRAMRMKAPAVVTLASAQVRDLASTFEATGSVEAPLSVKIAPKITGRIDYLEVREGDRVHKGQVLVRIDDSQVEASVQQAAAALAEAQYRLAQAKLGQNSADVSVDTQIRQQKAAKASAQADYNQSVKNYEAQLADAQAKIDAAKAGTRSAQANLQNAKIKYERAQTLFKKGFVAQQQVDDAQAALEVQQASLEVTEQQLSSAKQQYSITKERADADREAAKAKLEQAKASVEYAEANTSQKSAYRQSLDALRAGVDAAKASLASAKANRSDTVLKSPLDGFVTGRYSDPGAIASPTQPILAVQFVKQVWVSISVPDSVCTKIHIGQPATIRFDAIPNREFAANVIQINPSADPQSRQFTVRVVMSNANGLLKPGMFAHVSLQTDRVANAVVVPREAVKRDRLGAYVMAPDAQRKATRIAVTTGAEDTDFVSITSGLEPGQKVVTISSSPVREGQMLMEGGGKGRGTPPQPSPKAGGSTFVEDRTPPQPSPKEGGGTYGDRPTPPQPSPTGRGGTR